MKTFFIFIFCSLACVSGTLFAVEADKDWTFDPVTSTLVPNYLGKVKVVNGQALIGERELKKGSKVYNNDLIQTKEKTYLVLEMIDLTTLTLGPQTDFKVSNWAYRTKNDREAEFTILKGQWRALVRSKSKKVDQLKIKTPLISMGIRGTELMVNVLELEGKEITQVALLAGAVHLEGKDPGNIVDLVPGDHTVLVKSETGTEHKERKLNTGEINSYREYVAPEIPRLLEPIKSESLKTEKVSDANKDHKAAQPEASEKNSHKSESAQKSVKENLRILNKIREENRKNK